MLRTSIVLFAIGLIAMVLGMNQIAGISIETGRIVLFVFLVLAMISFLLSITDAGKPGRKRHSS